MNSQARMAIFKDFTNNLATLSKCSERHVAAIITDRDLTQVYSIGINGIVDYLKPILEQVIEKRWQYALRCKVLQSMQ